MKFQDKYNNVEIKGMTIKQPYASLLLQEKGYVPVKTYPSRYRGWILFSASKDWYGLKEVRELSGKWFDKIIDQTYGLDEGLEGHAFAVGKLVDVRELPDKTVDKSGVTFLDQSSYFGLYGYIFEQVQKVSLISVRGGRRLFTLPEDVLAGIELV